MRREKRSGCDAYQSIELSEEEKAAVRRAVDSWFRPTPGGAGYRHPHPKRKGVEGHGARDPFLTSGVKAETRQRSRKPLVLISAQADLMLMGMALVAVGVAGVAMRGFFS